MPRRRALLLLAAALPACAELRRPVIAAPPPPGLLPENSDPGRAAVAVLAEDFRGAGAGIANDPARIARGSALLEWMATEINAQPRWAPLSRDVRNRMQAARSEMRAALGVDPLAPTPRVAAALGAAHLALARSDRAAGAAALSETLFPRGGEVALARLSNPGPLGEAEIATGLLAEEVRVLDATGGWTPGSGTPVPAELGGMGGRPGF
ncbi:hypothetical protein [Muricoccus radiodurans]|uniref:hypothetical protein n=1 Tax=Muricoccus radiodurans TaxID=2231721 RepID=UPI003CF29F37